MSMSLCVTVRFDGAAQAALIGVKSQANPYAIWVHGICQ